MKKGFTLVEMIVTVAILMLLTAVGAVSISRFNTGRKIETVRNELMTQIKLARNMAITNQIFSDMNVGVTNFVKVDINSVSGIGMTVSLVGSTGVYSSQSIANSKGISLDSTKSFGFWLGTGRLVNSSGVFASNGVGVTVMSLTGEVNDRSYILIDKSGLINEK